MAQDSFGCPSVKNILENTNLPLSLKGLHKVERPKKKRKNVGGKGRVLHNPLFDELKNKYERLKLNCPTLDGFPIAPKKDPKKEGERNNPEVRYTQNANQPSGPPQVEQVIVSSDIFEQKLDSPPHPSSLNIPQNRPVQDSTLRDTGSDFFSDSILISSNVRVNLLESPGVGFFTEEVTVKRQMFGRCCVPERRAPSPLFCAETDGRNSLESANVLPFSSEPQDSECCFAASRMDFPLYSPEPEQNCFEDSCSCVSPF